MAPRPSSRYTQHKGCQAGVRARRNRKEAPGLGGWAQDAGLVLRSSLAMPWGRNGDQLGRAEALSHCEHSYERSKDMAGIRPQDPGLRLGFGRIQEQGWALRQKSLSPYLLGPVGLSRAHGLPKLPTHNPGGAVYGVS